MSLDLQEKLRNIRCTNVKYYTATGFPEHKMASKPSTWYPEVPTKTDTHAMTPQCAKRSRTGRVKLSILLVQFRRPSALLHLLFDVSTRLHEEHSIGPFSSTRSGSECKLPSTPCRPSPTRHDPKHPVSKWIVYKHQTL